ncbi:MAG: hypothetical protein KAR01_01165, partial [Desulfocapsa sp.]|nr:hypothetical protein [Desulfocapsa sp.]
EAQLKDQILETDKKNKKNKAQISTLRIHLAWIQNIVKLEKEQNGYINQLEKLKNEKKEQHDTLSCLQPALVAKEIEPLHDALQHLNETQQKSIKEQDTLTKTNTTLEKSRQTTIAKTITAAKNLKESEKLKKSGFQTIRIVEKLDHKLLESKKFIKEQTNSLNKTQKTLKKEASILNTLETRLIQLKEDKANLDIFFKKNAKDENLVEEFRALEIIINRLIEMYPELAGIQKTKIQISQEIQRKNGILETLTKEKERAQADLASAIVREEKIQNSIKVLTAGENFSNLQEQFFKTEGRRKSIHEVILHLEQQKEKTEQITTLKEQVSAIIKQSEERSKTLSISIAEQKRTQREVTLLESNLLLLARIQTLEEDRNELLDGTPCPLCGSLSHPYNQSTLPTVSKEKNQLEIFQSELAVITKQITDSNQEDVVSKERINYLNKQIKDNEIEIDKTQKVIEQLLSDLELTPLSQASFHQLEQELQNTIEHKRDLEDALKQYEKLIKELNREQNQIKEFTTITQTLEKGLVSSHHALTSTEKDNENLTQQEVKITGELTLLNNDLSTKLLPHGSFEITEKNLDSILLTLKQRVNLWKEKKDEEMQLSPELIKVEIERSHKQTFCTKEEKQLTEQEKQCASSQNHFNELQHQRKTLFGKKETKEEETLLDQSVTEARDNHSQSLVASGNIEKEITAVNTLQKHLTNETNNRSEEITIQKKLFNDAISQSIFATYDDFSGALRTPQQLKELQELQSTLQQKETELTTLIKEKSAHLRIEKEKQL